MERPVAEGSDVDFVTDCATVAATLEGASFQGRLVKGAGYARN